MNDLHRENIARVTRRQLFGSAASGVGTLVRPGQLTGPTGPGIPLPPTTSAPAVAPVVAEAAPATLTSAGVRLPREFWLAAAKTDLST